VHLTIEFLPGSHSLQKARSPEDGRELVVSWTYSHGKGRVFTTTLGHNSKTASLPSYQRLLAGGLLWRAAARFLRGGSLRVSA
jgi:type 1 glutamine amidotransferase